MTGLYNSILETIGNTPIVRINSLAPEHVEMYVKIEAFNPLGSVKDRLALGVIEAAEKSGELKPGQTVIEATSGNTGIGLAMVCAAKGYPLVVVMAESFSVERRKLMRFLGAKVVLTPASEKGTGMVAKARELSEQHGWYLTRQFENPANADVHSDTTAQEILRGFGNNGLDYWVTGFGTGGTLKGVSRVLKSQSPATKIVAAEPDNSPLLTSGFVQPFNADGSAASSHPNFRPHLMQGWTPDFISKLANDALDADYIDVFTAVAGGDALQMSKELAQKEGILCGPSSGASFAAGLEIAKTAPAGSKILVMLPDTGERYLSTPLFAEIAEDMTPEESQISTSTPHYRFDVSAAAPAAAKPAKATLATLDTIARTISEAPVVLYALEWCEFCWSVRKMFDAAGIAYKSIDLDSVEYQQDNKGAELRLGLREITGAPTIPQIFIGANHVGGATETFDAFNDGSLAKMLSRAGLGFDIPTSTDAYSYLPKWLHAR